MGSGLSCVLFGVYNCSNVTSLTPSSTVSSTRTQSFPLIPFAFTALLLAMVSLPRVNANTHLKWSFVGVGGVLLLWELLLWIRSARRGRSLEVEFVPVRSHYVQATVQFCIIMWWGWFTPSVIGQLPLIFAQLFFLYSFEGLITWSRGKSWRLGFGPMPIIFSTNLLLWFKDDWYYMQFVMITLGALAKQFITWEREGKRTHIFNPSAFGQSLIALGLIAAGLTNEWTWGREIATTFETPHMLIVIFALGLVVQYLFHVTLMTVAAVMTLFLINVVYFQVTGTYIFISTNLAAPIFLGVHLLVTDPATSPKTNVGRVIFGALYGTGYAILFRVLGLFDIPLFWDKLLPVPILNLMVPMIDRVCRRGALGWLNDRWMNALSPPRLNLAHMAVWAIFFGTLVATGYTDDTYHPGNSIPFWKRAFAEGKPQAGRNLVILTGGRAKVGKVPDAYNELGVICMEGRIIPQNRPQAAIYFTKACRERDVNGCINVAILYLFMNERRSDADVTRALDMLEAACGSHPDERLCYLMGYAYETGRGRPKDPMRALDYYRQCKEPADAKAKGLARLFLSGHWPQGKMARAAQVLEQAAAAGDAESCWYLAYIYKHSNDVAQDDQRSRSYLEQACKLGLKQACDALQRGGLPPYVDPPVTPLPWATAYPI